METPILSPEKNDAPVELNSIERIPQVTNSDLINDTDQQFNNAVLKSRNISVIRDTANMLYDSEDTPIMSNYGFQTINLNNPNMIVPTFLNSKTTLMKNLTNWLRIIFMVIS